MPEKPDIQHCLIDAPRLECICGLPSKPDEIQRHPIQYCDKATAFRPEENEKRRNYVKALEDELRRVIEKGEPYR